MTVMLKWLDETFHENPKLIMTIILTKHVKFNCTPCSVKVQDKRMSGIIMLDFHFENVKSKWEATNPIFFISVTRTQWEIVPWT